MVEVSILQPSPTLSGRYLIVFHGFMAFDRIWCYWYFEAYLTRHNWILSCFLVRLHRFLLIVQFWRWNPPLASICTKESELHQSSSHQWIGFLEKNWLILGLRWRCSEKTSSHQDRHLTTSFLASISRSEAFLRIVHQGLFQRGTESGGIPPIGLKSRVMTDPS